LLKISHEETKHEEALRKKKNNLKALAENKAGCQQRIQPQANTRADFAL
jgi:hypothetical protein